MTIYSFLLIIEFRFLHNMEKLMRYLFFTLIFSFIFPAYAQSIQAEVNVLSLKVLKQKEIGKDELYLSFAEYRSHQKPKIFRLPKHRIAWTSEMVNRVKDLKVWEGNIKEHESMQLVISLMEQDSPPWDLDDLIGTASVKLCNQCTDDKDLKVQWAVPSQVGELAQEESRTDSNIHKIRFSGPHGEYELILQVKTK